MYISSSPATQNYGGAGSINTSARRNDVQAVPADKSAMLDQFIHQFSDQIAKAAPGIALVPLQSAQPKAAQPDGKIGDFSQGKLRDCFALTALYATAQTPEGRQKIKDSITQTGNGVYSVQFAGDPSHKKFTVTQAEVDKARAAK